MSNMLNTGISGLLAFQTALDTTSHNISNSATEGYSRQRAQLTAALPQFLGGSWLGKGVQVETVRRAYDELVASQVRSAASGRSQWDVYASLAAQVNNLFSDSSTGLSASLQRFSNAAQGVANAPTSSAERQVLLSETQVLVSQFNSYADRLNELDARLNTQLVSEAKSIGALANSIADVNGAIINAEATGQPPNDFLDQRDRLLDELATHINIGTTKQNNGTVSVFIGTGQALVVGTTTTSLVVNSDPYDQTRKGLSLQYIGGSIDVTENLSGGTVGGLLNFRDEVLDPAKNTLGRVAVAVVEGVNTQQASGIDLYGNLGSALFAVGGVQVLPNGNNTGSGTVAVTRSDVTALTDANYLLTRTATGWSLQRTDTGQVITLTGSGTVGSPFVGDGLSIVVGGAANTSDRFLIRPTSTAAAAVNVLLTDPKTIAAAAPIIAAAGNNNAGAAIITQGTVVDATDPNLRNTITIQFQTANTYTTDGGTTSNAYTSGQPITVNGWQVTITGTPVAGDTFVVQDNVSGTGDNRNALLISGLFNKNYLDGSTTSINATVGEWIADVGVKSNRAESSLSTQTHLYEDNRSVKEGISGVNLDEEAANLVRFQQAYAAAAQVVSSSSALFDALISAIRS